MNKKRIYKVLAAFLIFGTFTSVAYACTPALVIIRHAEDDPYGRKQPGREDTLNIQGDHHASAYAHLLDSLWNADYAGFGQLAKMSNICPFQTIYGYYTSNPYKTAALIQSKLPANFKTSWNLNDMPKLEPAKSTLLVLNRTIMWGSGDNPDNDTFLKKIAEHSGANNKYEIYKGKSPMFNFMYVFTGQNQYDLFSFANAKVFVQRYDYYWKDDNEQHHIVTSDKCAVRIHTDLKVKIYKLY
ncbi:MAG: hypothetical protein K0R94_352 [Burkholderiales bacterium]|nr:hypothetical protein [Burkholderiales bacterium]